MKIKRLLRFYFKVDNLNKALNNLITKKAISSMRCGFNGEMIGQNVCDIIQVKQELSELWNYLDGILKAFSEDEISILRFYGVTRLGTKQLSPEKQKSIHRVVTKFVRHTKNLNRYEHEVRLVNKYYGLI